MSTQKTGFNHPVNNYNFPLRGRIVLVAPLNTKMIGEEASPSLITPFDETTIPAGWTYLGPVENGQVNLTLNIQTESIFTGVIPTERKRYISQQQGVLEANLLRYEPGIMGTAFGGDLDALVAASGSNRAYRDLWLGGKLGAKQALLVVEDYDDDNLLEDATGGEEFEQTWYYNPKTQRDGDISLGQEITKTPVVPLRFALFGFLQGSHNRLLQVRFVAAA